MRKTIILGLAVGLLASSPVMARGSLTAAQAQAHQQAAASNEGVSLSNVFEAPQTQDSLKTVPDVSAPVINAAPETCGIPVAGGAAWMGFGFTAGTAYTDQECVDRLNARQFVQMGAALGGGKTKEGRAVIIAGVELMCEGKKQAALQRAGIKCGAQPEAEAEKLVRQAPASDTYASNDAYVSNDDGFGFQASYGD